jgi:hypothetical protein
MCLGCDLSRRPLALHSEAAAVAAAYSDSWLHLISSF